MNLLSSRLLQILFILICSKNDHNCPEPDMFFFNNNSKTLIINSDLRWYIKWYA